MLYAQTPVQHLPGIQPLERAGVELLIKREDMNHPRVSGNKWWKLKYNIEEARSKQLPVLTFGGAWSNHLYATAAAAADAGLRAIGVVRGDAVAPLNSTLTFAEACGMELLFVDRSTYRLKKSPAFMQDLRRRFGDCYVIPEGGTNAEALRGCAEFAREHLDPLSFDRLFLPVGTGGTLAGIVAGLEGKRRVSGVAVLKGGKFLRDDIANLHNDYHGRSYKNWDVLTDYHLGGYAKTTPAQEALIRSLYAHHQLPLDHVYTSKAMLAIIGEAEKGNFRRGDVVLLLHTGGLQGSGNRYGFKPA